MTDCLFPRRTAGQAYAQHVSDHEIAMLRAGCALAARSAITNMKLAQDGDWVTIFFRTPDGLLLGTDHARASEGPVTGPLNAKASFDRRYPQFADSYVMCFE